MAGAAIRVIPTPLGQGNAKVIPGSTTFDDATSDLLSRTPGTAGNRKTFTRSYWVKLNQPDTDYDVCVFTAAGSDANNRYHSGIGADGKFYKYERIGGSDKLDFTSDWKFHDYSGWYHIVEVTNTTESSASDRFKLYVNGSQVDLTFSVSYTQDQETLTNNTNVMTIGGRYDGSIDYTCANMCEHIFIDGAVVAATEFGYTDPLTNTWRPKKYSGDYNIIALSGSLYTQFSNTTLPVYSNEDGGSENSSTWANFVNGDNTSYTNMTYLTDHWSKMTFQTAIANVTKIVIGYDGSGHCGYNGSASYHVGYAGSRQSVTLYNSSAITLTDLYFVSKSGMGVCYLYDCTVTVGGTDYELIFNPESGTNSFYLPLDGSGYSAFQTIGNMVQDQSGKQNNHTSSGSPTFQTDTPSGVALSVDNNAGITTTGVPTNYCTLNAVKRNQSSNTALTDGDLVWYVDGAWGIAMGTVGANTGKWYFECTHIGGTSGQTQTLQIGIAQEDHKLTDNNPLGGSTVHRKGIGWISSTGSINSNGGHDGFGTWTENDTVGCAVDIDEKKIWFHKNGTWILSRGGTQPASGSIGDPALGTHPIFDPSSESSYAVGSDDECNILPAIASQYGKGRLNFGETPFAYAPPKGFRPWCTANIPQPSAVRPDEYYDTVLYTGNETAGRTVGGFKFQPDLVWIKERNNSTNHALFDTVRGLLKFIRSNGDAAEVSDDHAITAFNMDGFTMGTGNSSAYINRSGNTYVAWGWKAGGNKNTYNIDDVGYSTASAAGLDGGSITPTGASVGTTQGFSIIKYVGNATGGASFSHGLSKAPKIIFHKNLDSTKDWYTITTAIDGSGDYFYLNQTTSINNSSVTVPTSSLVYMTASHESNTSGENYIAYMWHDVEGLQKFGSYTGNGAKNFVYLGFRPARVMVKRVTANSSPDSSDSYTSWTIVDTKRLSYNGLTPNHLFANHNDAEGVRGNGSGTSGLTDMTMEPMASGFYLNGPGSEVNASTGTYIYLAWAEAPFQNLYGAQSNAR